MSTSEALERHQRPEIGHIDRIPVRNLWLLMFYASDLFRYEHARSIEVESNPERIADLVSEILAHAVEARLMRNLSYGYQGREEVLNRVRGRIQLLRTVRQRLLERGQVACRYEELTVDTPRNRYVRAALEKVAGLVTDRSLAHRCRALAATLRRSGVSGSAPTRSALSKERIARHDSQDRLMLAAAKLAFDLALPTEQEGSRYLVSPERDGQWVRRLFEKGVAGFYSVSLTQRGWRVYAGRQFQWQIDGQTAGISGILPGMKTDIILESETRGCRIVIDTKFTAILKRGQFGGETLKSGYLYQMYAYLRSQCGSGNALAEYASGLLLHPSIGAERDETVVIQGHPIRFATVDLGARTTAIRERLLQVVSPVDGLPYGTG